MSDQTSAPGTSAPVSTPSATETTEAATKQFVDSAVAQVKEARAKQARLKGMPELAKVFAGEKPEAEKPAAAVPAAPSTPADGQEPPAVDPQAAELAARKEKRQQEIADLAKSGREKWLAGQAEKQERGRLAKEKADLEAERERIKVEKEKLEAATKDPFKFLEERGLPPEELARRVMRKGDPTAQAQDLREEFESWKRQQAEETQARALAEKEARARGERDAQLSQTRSAEREFIQLVGDAAKFPSLNALYTPEEILIKAYRVVQAAKQADPDRFYEDSEIADFLEKEASPRIQKLREPTVQPAAPKIPETPAASVGQSEQGQKSRTLSSSMTSEVAVDASAFKKLPRAKQNQILAERLKTQLESKSRAK